MLVNYNGNTNNTNNTNNSTYNSTNTHTTRSTENRNRKLTMTEIIRKERNHIRGDLKKIIIEQKSTY